MRVHSRSSTLVSNANDMWYTSHLFGLSCESVLLCFQTYLKHVSMYINIILRWPSSINAHWTLSSEL